MQCESMRSEVMIQDQEDPAFGSNFPAMPPLALLLPSAFILARCRSVCGNRESRMSGNSILLQSASYMRPQTLLRRTCDAFSSTIF